MSRILFWDIAKISWILFGQLDHLDRLLDTVFCVGCPTEDHFLSLRTDNKTVDVLFDRELVALAVPIDMQQAEND